MACAVPAAGRKTRRPLRKVAGAALLIAAALAVGLLWRSDPRDLGYVGDSPAEPGAIVSPISGPLRVHASNPRYFADASGRAVLLTGSHTWNSVQNIEPPCFATPASGKPIEPLNTAKRNLELDYDGYLKFLRERNHNFFRLWVWEHATWMPSTAERVEIEPQCYFRTGPGVALDGGPRFDVTKFDEAWFQRVRDRVAAANAQGIYVAVMLFQGWSIEEKAEVGNPWRGHPFHPLNNINGLDGDLNDDEEGGEIHTMQAASITRIQEAYVRKMVEMLNGFDNVLWEIGNESHVDSIEWQTHMVRFIRICEAALPKQHPVGMTSCFPKGSNAVLFASEADWISPNHTEQDNYMADPPVADAGKVVILDTDHLWGVGGGRDWVWKAFARGHNPIFMDPLDDPPIREGTRRAMGHVRDFASRMDLAKATPRGELASTGFCLAAPGREYLIYLPFEAHSLESRRRLSLLKTPIRNARRLLKRTLTVDLSSETGTFHIEWFDPATGKTVRQGTVDGGARRSFRAPFAGDAVLYLHGSL